MKSKKNLSFLILILQIFIFLPVAVFINPIITEKGFISEQENNEPVLAQGIDLEIYVTDQQKPGVDGVIADFLASPLGYGVDSVTVKSSSSTGDVLAFLQSLMEGGTATATVIGLDVIWTALFAENGWIIELDPYLEVNELDDYSPGIVSSCIYNNKTYAYPYFMNLGVLYYRKDLMDEYFGVAGWSEGDFETWEGLNATANFILNNQSTPSKYPNLVGYIGQLDAYEGGVVNFVEWCGSNGAIKLIDNNMVNINTQNVTEAMEFIKALVPPQYTGVQGTPYIIPRTGLVDDEGSSVMRWLANNSIFMRQWTFAYGLSEEQNIEFGIAPLPHFAGASEYKTSSVGGFNLAVPSATTGLARQAAVNLTKFFGDQLAQEYELTSTSNFPALKSVYSSPPTGYEWIKNWTDQVDLTLSRPVTLNYSQVSSAIADSFSDLLSCQKSVDDALAELQENIEEILGVSLPESFVLLSTAEDPDDDGEFDLGWSISSGAVNYSVYQYDKFITEINGSLSLLANEITAFTLPLSGYKNGVYYFIVVAHNEIGDTLSNCIEIIISLALPGSFTLLSTADDPDDDGEFELVWSSSSGAVNYSVYQYDKFITEINGSLTLLANETTDITLPLSGFTNGTYYFIVSANNLYGYTLSDCIEVEVAIPPVKEKKDQVVPGYNGFMFIAFISLASIILIFRLYKKKA